ncbi:TPA: single-stranded DNA-binding protein, partial [Streptococcus agalactiae]
GYFKENKKGDKVYKNFIVKSLNKIENKEKENEEE